MNPKVNEGNAPTSSTIKSYDPGAEKFVTSTQKSSKRETEIDFDIDDVLSYDFDFGEYENKVNTTEEYNVSNDDGIKKVIVSRELIF